MNKKNEKLPLVALYGRTNVGKSTLFNRFSDKNKALVSAVSGTTRDGNFSLAKWQGKVFNLIDLAGPDFYKENNKHINEINTKLSKQIEFYLEKADLILFVVDNKTGLIPSDKVLSDQINKNRKLKEKTLLVVNKVDNFKYASESADFYKLNLGEPNLVSALSGSGSGDLLDTVCEKINAPDEKLFTKKDDNIKVCILGKPNVGKSSLLNKILGYERVVVSSEPHTTREPQNTDIKYKDKTITFIDTAGINKKNKKLNILGRSSIRKSLITMKKSDIVLLVIEGGDSLTHQESSLVQEIVEAQKSLIIISNKWDLLDDEEKDTKLQTEKIYDHLPFVTWAPIHFISCVQGKNEIIKINKFTGEEKEEDLISKKINNLLKLILQVNTGRNTEIKTEDLYALLLKIVKIHKPTKAKGYKRPHIRTIKQTKVSPPSFEVTVGPHDTMNESYVRFIKNQIRKNFNFTGTPIDIYLTKKAEKIDK
ncbi:ribosome biogenesis GTPase Der [bacterium]|nr:ribosome biogenesis GTPase Der [bacterium]